MIPANSRNTASRVRKSERPMQSSCSIIWCSYITFATIDETETKSGCLPLILLHKALEEVVVGNSFGEHQVRLIYPQSNMRSEQSFPQITGEGGLSVGAEEGRIAGNGGPVPFGMGYKYL